MVMDNYFLFIYLVNIEFLCDGKNINWLIHKIIIDLFPLVLFISFLKNCDYNTFFPFVCDKIRAF